MEEKLLCKEGVVREIMPGGLRVETTRRSACAACPSRSACLAGGEQKELLEIPDEDPRRFKAGEEVDLYMEKSSGGKAVFFAYLLPFIILFSTLFLTASTTGKELLAFFMAILATASYYLLLWLLNKKQMVDRQFVVKARKKS